MKIILRAAVLFSVFCSSFVSAMSLEKLQQKLLEQPVIRARFEQVRTIKDIPQPLKSSGEMMMSRGTGIFWHQTAPFSMTLVLMQNKMVQKVNDQPAQVVTAENNPQMFQFNQLLGALFTVDRSVLEHNFRLNFTDTSDNHWQLELVPTTTPLNKLFTRITLEGGRFIDAVRLYDKQGDTTAVNFSQYNTTPAQLTAKEQSQFEIN